jgi:hypothetical protein
VLQKRKRNPRERWGRSDGIQDLELK